MIQGGNTTLMKSPQVQHFLALLRRWPEPLAVAN
jgi:hypothetical protein